VLHVSVPTQSLARRIIIVGGGVAGLSVAIWLKRFGFHLLILEEGPKPGGQLWSLGNRILDYPGVPEISGASLAGRMIRHARLVEVEIRRTIGVRSMSAQSRVLQTDVGPYSYSRLIVATGSRARRLEVPGESDMIHRGEAYSASRDGRKFSGRTVAVVGGGDRAVEGALLLAAAGAKVILIHRSPSFRAQRLFVTRMMTSENIIVSAPAEVVRIVGDDRVSAIEIRHNGGIAVLECCAVFVRIGVVGNAEFTDGCLEKDKDGFIVVDGLCRTSSPWIWAIGDIVARSTISSISTATGHAALVAKQLSMEEEPDD
jgi:thioredoxin reductase (NADPH)